MQNGIGSFAFGSGRVEGVDAYLVPFLGGATSVVTSIYPEVYEGYDEYGAEETGFRYPLGRSACYSNELCTYFGGVDPAALGFVGYRQADGVGSLATASGVAAGSTGAEFPGVIVVEPGGCYSTGGGTADGVRLFLQSSGTLFLNIDAAGAWTPQTPQAPQAPTVGEVAVLSLFGGDEPYSTFDDC
jgi:hypothetical protein